MRQSSRLGLWKVRQRAARLRLERLEDRSLPSFGFGSAFGFGGAGDDRGNAIVLDSAGSMFVAGFYAGAVDFDPNQTNPNSIHTLTATDPNSDGYMAKYLADGTFQWATDLGPGFALEPAVQGANVFVPVRDATTGGRGGMVYRLDGGSGAVTWTTTLSNDGADAVAVSPSGSLYADGYSSNGTSSQAIVAQLDPATGTVLWSRTSSGGSAGATRLAVDGSGNAFATGFYSGTTTFGSSSLTSYSGASDAFVWKLNTGGDSLWAGTMGSSGGTQPWGITTDGSGNAYVTGYWYYGANNFNPGSGKAVSLTNHGGADIFIVKLAPGTNGAMKLGWARDIGGSGDDIGNALTVDGAGNVYTVGGFTGTVNFNPNNGRAQYLSGGGVFVSKLDASGNYVAAAGVAGSAGGNGLGMARGIALDGTGNVYVTGFFKGTADFDPTGGTYNLTPNGGFGDAFVLKLTQTSPLLAADGATTGDKAANLTDAQLQPIVAAAIDRWAAAGLDSARLDIMRRAVFAISDLGGSYLGLADAGTHAIRIDDDAAGHGWFVDSTPRDDTEFAAPTRSVQRRMDLLSVVAHELGHLVGLDDDHGADHAADVMGDSLAAGVRRVPMNADVHSAEAGDNHALPAGAVPLAGRLRHRRR
jgi:hypothetical protein